jgi:DNA-binding transcriptional ArsR family regulator
MTRLSNEQLKLVTERARALSDPTRVHILEALGRAEESVGALATALRCQPSTVSKHLQVLFHARLVERRREASTVRYSIAATDLLAWCRYLGSSAIRGRSRSARLSPNRVRGKSRMRQKGRS